MPKVQESAGQINTLLSDFATKLKDVEERHSLLKERTLLLNQTFLKQGKKVNNEINLIKESLSEIKQNTENITGSLKHIVTEMGGFARKEELKILERYMKLWEPLKFVKEEDIQNLIQQEIKKSRLKKSK